jgi:hypothetical protein
VPESEMVNSYIIESFNEISPYVYTIEEIGVFESGMSTVLIDIEGVNVLHYVLKYVTKFPLVSQSFPRYTHQEIVNYLAAYSVVEEP